MKNNYTFSFLLESLNGQLICGLEIVGKDSLEVCKRIIGDKDPLKAEQGTIRALYGTDSVRNCVDAASTPEMAIEVLL